MVDEPAAPAKPRDLTWLRLLLLTALWLAATRFLPLYAIYLVPLSLARQMTLQTYLMMVQVVVTLVGLGLAVLLLRAPKRGLGLGWPTGSHLLFAVAATPIIYVAASYLAIGAAFRTLMEEIARGGTEVSRQNAGEFGRALKQDPAVLTVLWSAVLAPIAEELLFRGALWSFITDLTRRLQPAVGKPRDSLSAFLNDSALISASRAVRTWLATGGIATALSALLFGWMHADMPGGIGIVRIVSTTCLGIACGAARHWTGSVVAAILMHFIFNALSIGQTRRWWSVGSLSNYFGVSILLSAIAALCAAGIGASLLIRRARTRRSETLED
jgi:membrane protease YdiL (CAAX protease family)